MKILEINAYNYRRGGSETVFLNTIDELGSAGHDVVRFALKWPENFPDENDGLFPESKDTRKGALRPVNNIVNYFYHFEAARNLQRLIDKEKPDVAHIHLIWGQLTPSILKVLKRNGIPAVLTIHDYRIVCPASVCRTPAGNVCEECGGKNFTRCIANACCKGSKPLSVMMAAEQYVRNALFHPSKLVSGIVYVSDFAKQLHEKYMPELKKVDNVRIYNFSPAIDAEPQSKSSDSYFLYFGRLSQEKGVLTLLKAVEKLPDMRLKIVGTGPLEAELKEYASSHGLSRVEFLGFKTGKELEQIIRGARFTIVPSEWYENNPMTVIESYSVATPVIGAAIGGIPEIIVEGKTGYLFPPGDSKALAECLMKASALTPEAYSAMRSDALEFARENFSKQKAIEDLTDFFRHLRT